MDFKNTVIVMTSNLGSHLIQAMAGQDYEDIKDAVWAEVKQHFRPEFLNRVDETIVFHELSKAEVTQIVDLMIARTQKQLESQGVGIELLPAAKLHLAEKGYDPTLGARPLRRAIQRLVEDPLSERILWKEFHAGETVVVDVEGDSIAFRTIEGIEPPSVELAGSGSEG